MSELLSLAESASYLSMSMNGFYDAVRRGDVPVDKTVTTGKGKFRYFSVRTLDEYNSRRQEIWLQSVEQRRKSNLLKTLHKKALDAKPKQASLTQEVSACIIPISDDENTGTVFIIRTSEPTTHGAYPSEEVARRAATEHFRYRLVSETPLEWLAIHPGETR